MPSLNYLQGMAGRFGRGANTLGSMVDPRQRFAQQLQMESMDTSPAFVGEGISRLGKALVGALLAKRSMEDQADASRWLTAKMPDRTRQPTEAEALADPKLEWLQQAAMRGGPDVSQQPTRDKFATREYENILGDFRELRPDTDDVLMGIDPTTGEMGTGRIPKTLQELSVLNYLQEQHKDFPEQTEFTHPFTGEKDTASATHEDWVIIPKMIEEKERKFAEQMEDARQASMKYRPRDYAQELASGMEAYRSDPKHQISDPYTRMEWLRESAQGREANPFISRMLENLMFADMQREIAKEDIESARGFQTGEREARQKFEAGESELDRKSREKTALEKSVGLDPSNVREWKFYSNLPPDKQEAYLTMKRADKSFNIGGSVITPSQTDPTTLKGETATTLKPSEEPSYIKKAEEIKQEAKLGAKRTDDLIRMQPKAFSALGAFQQKTNFMKENITQALNNISGWSTEFGAALGGWPGSQAQALKTILNTIKANVGFQSLQEMRANSPTGGALGQVSERELAYLQATLGDIAQEQDGAILAEKLRAMQGQIEGMGARLQQAYDMTFRPLTEAEGGDGNQYTTRAPVPFSPTPQNLNNKNDDPVDLGL